MNEFVGYEVEDGKRMKMTNINEFLGFNKKKNVNIDMPCHQLKVNSDFLFIES